MSKLKSNIHHGHATKINWYVFPFEMLGQYACVGILSSIKLKHGGPILSCLQSNTHSRGVYY